jgi:hypothetical protein
MTFEEIEREALVRTRQRLEAPSWVSDEEIRKTFNYALVRQGVAAENLKRTFKQSVRSSWIYRRLFG